MAFRSGGLSRSAEEKDWKTPPVVPVVPFRQSLSRWPSAWRYLSLTGIQDTRTEVISNSRPVRAAVIPISRPPCFVFVCSRLQPRGTTVTGPCGSRSTGSTNNVDPVRGVHGVHEACESIDKWIRFSSVCFKPTCWLVSVVPVCLAPRGGEGEQRSSMSSLLPCCGMHVQTSIRRRLTHV